MSYTMLPCPFCGELEDLGLIVPKGPRVFSKTMVVKGGICWQTWIDCSCGARLRSGTFECSTSQEARSLAVILWNKRYGHST